MEMSFILSFPWTMANNRAASSCALSHGTVVTVNGATSYLVVLTLDIASIYLLLPQNRGVARPLRPSASQFSHLATFASPCVASVHIGSTSHSASESQVGRLVCPQTLKRAIINNKSATCSSTL